MHIVPEMFLMTSVLLLALYNGVKKQMLFHGCDTL